MVRCAIVWCGQLPDLIRRHNGLVPRPAATQMRRRGNAHIPRRVTQVLRKAHHSEDTNFRREATNVDGNRGKPQRDRRRRVGRQVNPAPHAAWRINQISNCAGHGWQRTTPTASGRFRKTEMAWNGSPKAAFLACKQEIETDLQRVAALPVNIITCVDKAAIGLPACDSALTGNLQPDMR